MKLRSWTQNGMLLNALLAISMIMAMALDLMLTNGITILALTKARLSSQWDKLQQESRALGLDTSGASDALRLAISTSSQNIAQIETSLLGEAEIGQWLVAQNAAASRRGLITLRLTPEAADPCLSVRRYTWLLAGSEPQLLDLLRTLEKEMPIGISLNDVTLLLNAQSNQMSLVISAVVSPAGASTAPANRQE